MEEGSSSAVEALHKMYGSVEVAKDLVGRTEAIYVRTATTSDIHVLECFERAAFALSLVSEALRGQLRSTSLGPAA